MLLLVNTLELAERRSHGEADGALLRRRTHLNEYTYACPCLYCKVFRCKRLFPSLFEHSFSNVGIRL